LKYGLLSNSILPTATSLLDIDSTAARTIITPSKACGCAMSLDPGSLLKLLTPIAGALSGIYGTASSSKKEGRLGRHHYVAITLIVVIALIGIAIQIFDIKATGTERARLQRENDRQERILTNLTQVGIESEHNLMELRQMRAALHRTENSLHQQLVAFTKRQKSIDAQAKEITVRLASVREDVAQLESATTTTLARLTHPLSTLSFSYELNYDDADKRFPRYYRRLQTLATRLVPNPCVIQGGGWLPDYEQAYPGFDRDEPDLWPELTNELATIDLRPAAAPVNAPARQFTLRGWLGTPSFPVELLREEHFNRITNEHQGPIEIAIDLDTHTITKRVRYAAVRSVYDDGTIVSERDILNPAAGKNLVVDFLRESLGKVKPPRLSELIIHFNINDDHNVIIPGSACRASPELNGVLTCNLALAHTGSASWPSSSQYRICKRDTLTPLINYPAAITIRKKGITDNILPWWLSP